MNGLEWFGIVADSIGIVGAVISALIWWRVNVLRTEAIRQKQLINIILYNADTTDEYHVNLPVTRAEFSRVEVQGRLRLINNGNFYNVKYMSMPDYIKQINLIKEGAHLNDTLTITCTDEEYNQFEVIKKQEEG